MQAHTIDEVISFLDQIVKDEVEKGSKLAYFPILYREVTKAIKVAINNKEFEDNPRMERLDVVFANRYLEAYTQFKEGQKPSTCWAISFKQGHKFWPIVLQHLLLGINAHINLDLGIAAAEVAGDNIEDLKGDFSKINDILSSMVDGVQANIDKVSPIIGIMDRLAGKLDERLVDFSIQLARDGAWEFSCAYADADIENKQLLFKKRDASIAWLGKDIAKPGILLAGIAGFVKIFEWKRVSRVAPVLEGKP
ncbi:hypothetical protein BFP97_10150 [Roseivirga sp. 4D4]|uniref:DUF5995 family protein n=1 Tax=Roseivirga sp. 4D4 TaxID=1889784 RepID=UPI000852C4F6|nr:DUF5995 family protein [Roseivirga sp. 4D4]OEK01853.1 hypothetical protein BFP97_10150 [Roseivirga sp. 4D4]